MLNINSIESYPKCLKQICDYQMKMYGWWSSPYNFLDKHRSYGWLPYFNNDNSVSYLSESVTIFDDCKCGLYQFYNKKKEIHELMKKRMNPITIENYLIKNKYKFNIDINSIIDVLTHAHPIATPFLIEQIYLLFNCNPNLINDFFMNHITQLLQAENFGCVAFVFDVLKPKNIIKILQDMPKYNHFIHIHTNSPSSFPQLMLFKARYPKLFDQEVMKLIEQKNFSKMQKLWCSDIFCNVCKYGTLESMKLLREPFLKHEIMNQHVYLSSLTLLAAWHGNIDILIYLTSDYEIEHAQKIEKKYNVREFIYSENNKKYEYTSKQDLIFYLLLTGFNHTHVSNYQLLIDCAKQHGFTLSDFLMTKKNQEYMYLKMEKPDLKTLLKEDLKFFYR